MKQRIPLRIGVRVKHSAIQDAVFQIVQIGSRTTIYPTVTIARVEPVGRQWRVVTTEGTLTMSYAALQDNYSWES